MNIALKREEDVMRILVTGGAGFIGSHTCVELIRSGFEVVVVDNLCNSSRASINRIEKMLNCKIPFYRIDVRNKNELIKIFDAYKFNGVIHFAGLKAVGDSVKNPAEYYDNNVLGTFALLDVMDKASCKKLVFSSSATVYGNPSFVPIKETSELNPINPYGRTKLIVENYLRDIFVADNSWQIMILRYFNPIGAHPSGLLGEQTNDTPNNLVPYIAQVANGKLKKLNIFGTDYETPDGSGVRDYVHVVDLAIGHTKALELLENGPQIQALNLGTGKGYSVFEVIDAFEKACGKKIPFQVTGRRPGDVMVCYADTSQAITKWAGKLITILMICVKIVAVAD